MSIYKKRILIFGLLGLLLLLTAVGGFLIVRSVDSNYATVLSSEVKLQKTAHVLGKECNDVQRALLNMLMTGDSLEIVKLKNEALEASRRLDRQIDKLDVLKGTKQGQELLTILTGNSFRYKQACASYIVLVDLKDNKSAVAFNKSDLYPALLTLQKNQEEIVDFIGTSTMKKSANISSSINKFGLLTVGISTLPVTIWIVGAFVLMIVLAVSFFRQKLKLF